MRDATVLVSPVYTGLIGFNPRVPCGTRLGSQIWDFGRMMFQSTRPVRDATCLLPPPPVPLGVSIHASRAGRDFFMVNILPLSLCFNPRVPCGTRPIGASVNDLAERVSIHASRAGRDIWKDLQILYHISFNPRVPCGTRQGNPLRSRPKPVSIHASRAGRDLTLNTFNYAERVSIHASRAGRDLMTPSANGIRKVSIHASRAGRDHLHQIHLLSRQVSIHASRAGRDISIRKDRLEDLVSIHASRAGRDGIHRISRVVIPGFNPRVPCGTRHHELLLILLYH